MTRRIVLPVFAAALTIAPAVGCDAKKGATFSQVGSAAASKQSAPPAADAAPAGGAKPAAPAEPPVERKIIFNGRLEIVVKDFDAAWGEVTKVIEANKGYFAKTEVVGEAGSRRSGTFTVKVPAERFRATVDALTRVGVATRNSTDSQDVTEEFVDVSARVKNLKAEEEVLNRLLKDAAGRLDDLFKIREQVRQNREQIERAEGRLKALAALSAMSTIVLTVREETNYVPPAAEPPPSFAGRVAAAFATSVGRVQWVGEEVLLFAVAAVPWLPLLVGGGLLLRWGVRAAMTPPAARIATGTTGEPGA